MKKLLTRTISGAILVFIIIEGTLWTTWSFYGLWTIIGILTLAEYYKLIQTTTKIQSKILPYVAGTIYIGIPIALATQMQPEMIVTIMTIVWMNDTGAYLVGSVIGRTKMAPKISPKKSWEGFFGGVVFAIATSLVWYNLYWGDPARSIEPLFQDPLTQKLLWVTFGAVISTAAVLGDLVESKFKRIIGVKDSGKIIPGHGGMLDRFDAALLAIPAAWIFVNLLLA